MFTWLRDSLRKWLGVAVATAAVDEDPATGLSIHQQLLVQAGERFLVHRKIAPPMMPPMVRGDFKYDANNDPARLGEPTLAYDDASNAPMWSYLNQANCGLGFPGYSYLAELSQRSEYRAPVGTLADEATREWIDITVKGKASRKKREERGEKIAADEEIDEGQEDKIEAIEERLEQLRVRDHFRKLSEVDGFFGRANLFIDIDPGSANADEVNQLPLVVDAATVKKGSLRGFKVVEPIWSSPYSYNATDPTKPDFYKPRAWFVIGKRIHASRFLMFVSREVADMLKPAYNFGGLSTTQLMEPYVFQWLRTRNSVSDLIHNFSVMVLKTDMNAVLQGDPSGSSGLMDRARLFVSTRDNQGLTLLDKTREDLVAVNVPLSTLDKLQAQSQEHMAAVCQEPLVKLTGITPSGLNASSEGEIQVWYDRVRSYQIAFYSVHLDHVIRLVQLDLFGSIDDSISFEFRPLSSPTVKELSEIRKADGETDDKYVAMGAVSPEEVRERLIADPNSGYNNLSGPAPTPPDQLNAEHGAGLEEEGKQADHERAGETAEEAHKRQLELETKKAKLKPPAKKK